MISPTLDAKRWAVMSRWTRRKLELSLGRDRIRRKELTGCSSVFFLTWFNPICSMYGIFTYKTG